MPDLDYHLLVHIISLSNPKASAATTTNRSCFDSDLYDQVAQTYADWQQTGVARSLYNYSTVQQWEDSLLRARRVCKQWKTAAEEVWLCGTQLPFCRHLSNNIFKHHVKSEKSVMQGAVHQHKWLIDKHKESATGPCFGQYSGNVLVSWMITCLDPMRFVAFSPCWHLLTLLLVALAQDDILHLPIILKVAPSILACTTMLLFCCCCGLVPIGYEFWLFTKWRGALDRLDRLHMAHNTDDGTLPLLFFLSP